MAYRLKAGKSVRKRLVRVIQEQIDKALDELQDDEVGRHEGVHQARKRFKKIRGALRLVRPVIGDTYSKENRWYRDTARRLAKVRDAEAMIGTLDALREAFDDQIEAEAFRRLRKALVARRKRIAQEEIDLDQRVAEVVADLLEARERAGNWRLDEKGFAALEGGLKKTYRRGRKAMRTAYDDPTPEHFHDWRKRVKYQWHHTRLLRKTWSKPLKARRKECKRLSDLLGDEHDLTVFRQLLLEEGDDLGPERDIQAILGLAERRHAELRERARPLGEKLYADKPKAFVRRMRACWRAKTRQRDQEPVITDEQVAVSV